MPLFFLLLWVFSAYPVSISPSTLGITPTQHPNQMRRDTDTQSGG